MPNKKGKKHTKRKCPARPRGSDPDESLCEPETTFCSNCAEHFVPRIAQGHLSTFKETWKTICLGLWVNEDPGSCSLCNAFQRIRGINPSETKYHVHVLQAAQVIYGDSMLRLAHKLAPKPHGLKFQDTLIFGLFANKPEPFRMSYAVESSKSNGFLIACLKDSDGPQFLDTSGYDHAHELWISEHENIFRSTKGEWRRTSIRAAINQAKAMGFIYEVRVDEPDTTYGRPIRPVAKAELETRRSEGIKHVYTTALQPSEMGDIDMPCTSGYIPQSIRKRTVPPIHDLNTNTFCGRVIDPSRIDYSLLRAWVAQCRTSCDFDNFVQDQKRFRQIRFCLIDAFTREIIEVGARRQVKYIALSYVWGGVSAEPQLDDWESLPTLPRRCVRVVEDALKVVKELGFRYLWVDNYCISRDSAQRHNQIANMDLVYKNAELTIIAAAGHDASYGLPGVGSRPRHTQQQVMIQGCPFIVTQPYTGMQSHSTSYSARGWTYQEFFFSRRRLVFTDLQVSFQCQHRCHALRQQEGLSCPPQTLFVNLTVAEAGARDYSGEDSYLSSTPRRQLDIIYLADGTTVLPTHDFTLPKYAPLKIFEFHVREYTQRKLSFDDDSLQAVESILNRFANGSRTLYHLSGLPYCGLEALGQTIQLGLLWTHGPTNTPHRRRPNFPSWSWTGWEGQVSWPPNDYCIDRSGIGQSLLAKHASTFKVARKERESNEKLVNVGAWRFFENGHVHPTELHFSSLVLMLRLRVDKGEANGNFAVYLDWLGLTSRLHITLVAPSVADFKEQSFHGIILRVGLLPSNMEIQCAYVLVIQPTQARNKAKDNVEYYERVGVMMIPVDPQFWEDLTAVKLQGCLI